MLSGVLESLTSVVYTSPNTWTKADYPGLVAIEVEIVAGGGGGGGAAGNSLNAAATGGGAGGRSIKRILVASLGTAETVTIAAGGLAGADTGGDGGTGGTTSFGAHCTATGGGEGVGRVTVGAIGGGIAGIGASGNLNLTGQEGGASFSIAATIGISGFGDGEGGGRSRSTNAVSTCIVGANGGGGSGAASPGGTGTSGGAGGAGFVQLVLFY